MQYKSLASFALALLLPACALSDIRPPELQKMAHDGSTLECARRGRALLNGALAASGGSQAWQRFKSADLVLEDEWSGFIGYLFRPWPGNPTRLKVRYDLGMIAARGEFLSGTRKGTVWGREGDRTWFQAPGQERDFHQRESVRFMFAAYQYFFELPARISEAPIVLYAGHRVRRGREYDLVFATWGEAEPHTEDDQYLLWIAEDTGLIEIAEYTIRDKFGFATGSNIFSDFRQVDGLTIPHSYWINQKLDDRGFVHRAQLEDVHFR